MMQVNNRVVITVIVKCGQNTRSLSTTSWTKQKNDVKPFHQIPGPSSFPGLGSFLHFLPGGSLHNTIGYPLFDKLYKTYGPLVRMDGFFGKPTFVTIFEPEEMAQILRSENFLPLRPGFESLEHYRKDIAPKKERNEISDNPNFKDVTGLITDQGEPWKKLRSTVNPILLQPKTIKLYRNALDEVASDMVEKIRHLRNQPGVIEKSFDDHMNSWSLESIGVVALGGRIGCLEANLPADSPARQLIQCVQDFFDIGLSLDFKPSPWRYISTPKYRHAMKVFENETRLCKHFISRAVEDIRKRGKSIEGKEKGVLEKLLEIDEKIAVTMAIDMLTAGVDTTSNTMLGVMYLLAANQDKQDILREEILSQDEKKPYLKACIKEAIRMMPITAGNLRQTTKDYNICGYHIPKDTQVVFAHQYTAMMDTQYPQPHKFIPERWIVGKTDPLYHGNAHPFAMSPFGFGTRQCIGKRVANLEFETFLSRLLKNFKIGWHGPPVKVTSTTLNYVAGPFNYVFKDL